MIERYMSKPTYVNALRYVEDARKEVFDFTNSRADFIIPSNTKQMTLFVGTPIGPKKTNPGDYIVKDDEGNLSVMSPDAFENKYLKVKSHVREK